MEIQLFQRLHRATFAILQPQFVSADMATGFDLQPVAEQAGEFELPHQRVSELIESIRENNHLGPAFEPEQELLGAREGTHAIDHFLYLRQGDPVLVKNVQPVLHQFVVIRLFAGRAGQCFDTGSFGNIDPDFRYENTFEVKTCDHGTSVRQCRRRLNQ